MSSNKTVLYTLTLSIAGSKDKGQSITITVPKNQATIHNIEPGDMIVCDVVEHHKRREIVDE